MRAFAIMKNFDNFFKQFEYNSSTSPSSRSVTSKAEENSIHKILDHIDLTRESSSGLSEKSRTTSLIVGTLPIHSDKTIGLKELYSSPNQKESVLKLLIVGHNPSDQSYQKGHYYANPVNRMWSLLRKSDLVPAHYTCSNDKDCPSQCSIGFTDVGFDLPDTCSGNITEKELYRNFRPSFYRRLLAHLDRVHENHPCMLLEDCYPRIIAFAGIRQWKALFPVGHPIHKMKSLQNNKRKKVEEEEEEQEKEATEQKEIVEIINIDESPVKIRKTEHSRKSISGLDLFLNRDVSSFSTNFDSSCTSSNIINYGSRSIKPPDWPKLLEKSIIYLLPSPSGAAAMSNEQREKPYLELGKLYKAIA
jgi:G:T/U-mismatch repair DNA glycosylase